MTSNTSVRILLLAPALLGETLALQLTASDESLELALQPEKLNGHPSLVIWSIETLLSLQAIQQELQYLQERWQPAPLLVLLPANLSYSREQLLNLPAAGLLQNSDLNQLIEAINTILGGGRVVQLQSVITSPQRLSPIMGLGQWLLCSGLQEINKDLQIINTLLSSTSEKPLLKFLINGRRRELLCAQEFLLWLWGPLHFVFESNIPLDQSLNTRAEHNENLSISLRERNAVAVWSVIRDRINDEVNSGINNATGHLLAIEGLQPEKRRELLIALINQLDRLLNRLRRDGLDSSDWNRMQSELHRQALIEMAGSYVQLPLKGNLEPVVNYIIKKSDFTQEDVELPEPSRMLSPLLRDQPVLVNGQLLPSDDPRSLLQLETLVSNWLIRSAELISSELLDACGSWPELRRYLLREPLLATRELERLRNQLNTQLRWNDWIERPIKLYESRRTIFQLREGRIEPIQITEPRDEELDKLGWWQQQVALLLEIRDALAPQVQALVRRIGDLAVVLLTEVVGKAIGLIGRGIAHGMGRRIGRG